MAKANKRTTKFLRKVAKGSVQKRKRFPARRKLADRRADGADDVCEKNSQDGEDEGDKKRVEEMSMDEFLDGGFDAVSDEEVDEEEDDDEEGQESHAESEDSEEEDDGNERDKEEEKEDDSDGEDIGDVGEQNRKLSTSISKHKRELEALRERDPEFYAYLQATDKGLLEFEGSDDESEDDEEKSSDDDDESGKKRGPDAAETSNEEVAELQDGGEDDVVITKDKSERVITTSVVESWCKQAKAGKIRSLRFLMQAYRSATHFGDGEEVDDVKIASSKCFNSIMLFVLKEVDAIFRGILGMGSPQEDVPGGSAQLQKSNRWKKVQPLVKSFLGNSLHLLGTTTDPTLVAFILRRVRASIPLLGACERLQKMYIKAVLGVFGSSDSKARVQSILFLRQAAVLLPSPALDSILRGAYKQFTANAKFVNAGSVPHISFMASCISELWGVDSDASYLHAFGFIRQLAVTMRSALNTKTKDAFLEVYCWQYTNCLELWAKVLSAHADNTELRPLVYPVAQLLMGAIRLVPTPRYFPLRLRLLSALASLSASTGYFVPMAPMLLEVLGWAELGRRPAAGGGALPNLGLQLRVSKRLLRSAALQEEVVASVMEMLAGHLGQWANHAAFPELSNTTAVCLRRFIKGCAVERFRRAAKQVLDAIEKTAVQVSRRRDTVDFSPKDLAQVAEFMAEGDKAGRNGNPLQRLAAELAEKGRQRRALVSASEVEVEEGDEEEEEDEADADEQVLSHGRHRAADSGEGSQSEDEETAGGTSETATLPFEVTSEDEDAGEDELVAYELSDDDDEDDVKIFNAEEVAQKKKGKGRMGSGGSDLKGKKRGREQGGNRLSGGDGKKRGKSSSPSSYDGAQQKGRPMRKPGKSGKKGSKQSQQGGKKKARK